MKNYLSSNDTKTVILAPNAFKGSLEAPEFCRIMAEELNSPSLRILSLPMCDGGDGSASITASYLQATPVHETAWDALGREHEVTYYQKETTAIVDLAEVCGLRGLNREEYDVMNANTAGLGIILNKAVKKGCKRILLGVGGSASIDGGTGALKEMGLKIVKQSSVYRNDLLEIKEIDSTLLNKNFKDIEWIILCDVENPLYGPQGAPAVFGPQKGATTLQISRLDQQLRFYRDLLLSNTGKDVESLKYGGAAGGIAAAFAALLNAQLVSGAEYCLGLSDFRNRLEQANLVITGEGKLDSQTLCGKLPGVIAALCSEKSIPVIAVAGISESFPHAFTKTYSLVDYAENLAASIRQPGYYLRFVARDIKKNILKLI